MFYSIYVLLLLVFPLALALTIAHGVLHDYGPSTKKPPIIPMTPQRLADTEPSHAESAREFELYLPNNRAA